MKKYFAGILAVLFLGSLAFAGNFSLKLSGGASYLSGGDLNLGLQGMNDSVQENFDEVSGSIDPFHLGTNFGAEFIYNITPRLGIGLGLESFRAGRDSSLEYAWYFLMTRYQSIWAAGAELSIIPITLNVHYGLPVGCLKINFFGGVGYYLGSFDVDLDYKTEFLMVGAESHWKGRKGTLGFQGGLGAEIPVIKRISLFAEVLGRFANFKEIKGDLDVSLIVFGYTSSESFSDAYLWYYEDPDGYGMLDTDTVEPDAAVTRKANIDLSGYTGRIGIKISF